MTFRWMKYSYTFNTMLKPPTLLPARRELKRKNF